jgi:hypothetical protein
MLKAYMKVFKQENVKLQKGFRNAREMLDNVLEKCSITT